MLTQVNFTNNIRKESIPQRWGIKNRGEVRKKTTQHLILCANIPKTSADVQERIKYDVIPQDSVLGFTAV